MILSNDFVDNYFENANPSYIIVYIQLLRLYESGDCNISRAAESLNVLERDILRALDYWRKLEVLTVDDDGGVLKIGFPLEKAEANDKENRHALPAVAVSRPVYTSKEIDYCLDKSLPLRKLFKNCENHMGKLLSYNDMCVLFSFHDWLRMPFELIELLVEYCCSNGHTSIRYIEKVAVTWADAGICAVSTAKERIKLYNSDFRKIMGALGKRDREPVKTESDFMVKWLKTFNMPLDIVLAACERTVMRTSRPTFQYADRIIERWHAEGIATPEDIEKSDELFRRESEKKDSSAMGGKPEKTRAAKPRKTAFSNFEEREALDFAEIQRLETERIDKELGL